MRRTLLGISQTELAGRVGLTFQQVQKYERGANQLAASRLFHFSQALEVPIDYFFEEASLSAPPSGQDNADERDNKITRRETLELARAFQSIASDTVRRDLITLVENIVKSLTPRSAG